MGPANSGGAFPESQPRSRFPDFIFREMTVARRGWVSGRRDLSWRVQALGGQNCDGKFSFPHMKQMGAYL